MKRRQNLLSLVLVITLLGVNSTHASKGGVEQLKNTFVVGFTYSNAGIPSLCNGVLLAADVIATARHCVVNKDGVYGIDYVFSPPGAKLDAAIDGTKVPTFIKQIIIPQQTPMTGTDYRLDLAFLVTNKPFTTGTPISIATPDDIARLNSDSIIAGYGYGEVFETGAPFSSYPRRYDLTWKNSSPVPGSSSLIELVNEKTVACQGDSGGPITLIDSTGKEVLLGVTSSAGQVSNGCGTQLSDGLYRLRMTLVSPFTSKIPKPVASQAPKVRKITCIKGAKKIVVTGVNPKCPKGYKLKK